MIPGYAEFEFDLPEALLAHLVRILDGMTAARLDVENLVNVPEAQGVYQLFLDDQLVYIGKTDAEAGLLRRLQRHRSKTQHRINLDSARMSFKAVRVFVFTAVDLETQLIDHYGGYSVVKWNGSGFGSNDPGRERDTTTYKAEHFDAIYPIDIDHQIEFEPPASGTAASVLTALKNAVPYVFRFENKGSRSRKPHHDLESTNVTITIGKAHSARSIIREVVRQLPPGWQATMLPSHVILYKEERQYPHGTVIALSPK